MGAKIASFLATLLLSIPLAAIGLMAVFGVPELVPAGGSTERGTVLRNVKNALNWGDKNSPPVDNTAPAYEDAPGFAPPAAPAGWPAPANAMNSNNPGRDFPQTGSRSASQMLANNPTANARDNNVPPPWSQQPAAPNHSEIPAGFEDSGKSPSRSGGQETPTPPRWGSDGLNSTAMTKSSPTGPLLSWKDASLRLTELGIKNFHLERGTNDGTFLFVCLYSPGDAPQVTHRFEAEAADPLLAVNQTLHQVDTWMQNRFAQSNFPPPAQKYSLNAGGQR